MPVSPVGSQAGLGGVSSEFRSSFLGKFWWDTEQVPSESQAGPGQVLVKSQAGPNQVLIKGQVPGRS
jgi:hypothetical protein